ncbi:MAG: hypothetical protein CBC82_05895 [Cellvibrionales bacterium TMED122]|nr:MAG: hypothetical protein CBC82_05895 [Cellvibrionales bacterium TMED122]
MRDGRFFLSWPGAHLREIGIAAGVGVALLCANFFWQPSVEPFKPAELAVASPAESGSSGVVEDESLDFIFRPLFLSARRPIERVDPEAVVVAEVQTQTLDQQLLDGYQLLGVFSSGNRGGVILLDKAKERVRVFTGDSVEGWVLESTDLRSAYFVDAAGGRTALELAVASTLPLPRSAARPPAVGDSPDVNSAGNGGGNNSAPPAYDGPVTFESIARRQKQELEAKANANADKP